MAEDARRQESGALGLVLVLVLLSVIAIVVVALGDITSTQAFWGFVGVIAVAGLGSACLYWLGE